MAAVERVHSVVPERQLPAPGVVLGVEERIVPGECRIMHRPVPQPGKPTSIDALERVN